MNESGLAGTGIEPVEVLYLDRQRLYSYSAQLADGLTVARRLLQGTGSSTTLVMPHEVTTQEDETTTRAYGGVDAGIKVGGHRDETTRDTNTSHGEGRSDTAHKNEQSAEDKAEHDNLLLLIERELRSIGALTDFTGQIERPGLYRFSGNLSFFDWDILTSLMSSWKQIDKAFPDINKGPSSLKPDQAKAFSVAMSAAGLAGIQVNITSEGVSVAGPLHEDWLSSSVNQIRMAYIRDTPIRGTVIAYAAPASSGHHTAPGLAGHIKFDKLMDSMMGESLRVVPLAVYLPVELADVSIT